MVPTQCCPLPATVARAAVPVADANTGAVEHRATTAASVYAVSVAVGLTTERVVSVARSLLSKLGKTSGSTTSS